MIHEPRSTLFYGFFLILPPETQRKSVEEAYLARRTMGLALASPDWLAPLSILTLVNELIPKKIFEAKSASACLIDLPSLEQMLGFGGQAIAIVQDLISVSGQIAMIQQLPTSNPAALEDVIAAFALHGWPCTKIAWWLVPSLIKTETITFRTPGQ